MNILVRSFTLSIILLFCVQMFSQVTIGSSIVPVSGSLLDLKETNVINGANSTRGLLYPRIHLTDINSLIDIAGGTLTDANDPEEHTGLMVYNVNTVFEGGEGLNVWDGTKWVNFLPEIITKVERDTLIQIKRDTLIQIRRDTLIQNVDKTYFTGLANQSSSLLSAAIEGSAWKTLAFQTVPIDSKIAYNTTTGVFKVKTTGTYAIYARYAYSGVALAQTAGIVVYRKPAGGTNYTLLYEDKVTVIIGLTGGVRAIDRPSVALNVGDELIFGLQVGGINLSVASGASALATIKEN